MFVTYGFHIALNSLKLLIKRFLMFTHTVLRCKCCCGPLIFDWLYWNWALEHVFFSLTFCYIITDFWYYRSLIYYGKLRKKSEKNKDKLRGIYTKNHGNFKNSKPRVQFYWFLQKKSISWVQFSSNKLEFFVSCNVNITRTSFFFLCVLIRTFL